MSERKIVKAEGKLEVLLRRVEQVVKVKELVSVVGLIVSFGLAVGRSARFYTVLRGVKGILVVMDWSQSMMVREIRCCEELKLVRRWTPVLECLA